ncbi:hypothetical protein [Methanococcus voltae]|uniref:Multidrug transporter EmrE-like cation transporter n=2 Tax=Methanococcus voltae TaxID=2188 RepID=A0A8J7UT33_METVO|nr:hypothetical protein [Methanococcus voltae]MBP2171798.1 multidrug transporter EmrE-like cation transporter [Methanococcus voltae]MBP2201264.1 multidrug transporter EmrE-like cation transporter [Methanococcus voltae]MCS3922794.1 multidrug transporter EmrE-like cation transporter [Methanococcus voltae PS]
MYYTSIVIVILSNIFYHIFQKSISQEVNPFISLFVTYLMSLFACIVIMLFQCHTGELNFSNLLTNFKGLNWASYGLGFVIVGLELGFLLAYRAGWNISIAALTTYIIVALLLLPIGVFIYNEGISSLKIMGILLCLSGLFLINK